MSGIDAPEKRQAFGNVSKQNLARLVFQKEITVEYDKRDRYGRIVGKVFVEGSDICIRQIEDGRLALQEIPRMSSGQLIE